MPNTLSPDVLLKKVESLQERHDFLSEESRRLRDSLEKKSMDQKKIKAVILALGVLAASLGGAAVYFGGKAGSLGKENRSLSQKVRDLDASLAENKVETSRLAAQAREFESALEGLRTENESLRAEVQKAKAEFESIVEEKVYLEDILIHKTKEIEKIKRQPLAGGDASAALEEKENEIARLSAQNAVLTSKIDRIYQAAQDKLASINVSKITLEETIARARRSIQEEYAAVDLGTVQVESAAKPVGASPAVQASVPAPAVSRPAVQAPAPQAAPQKTAAPRSGPRKEGRVRAINETHGFVVVDLGKVDNVSETTVLYVMKDGKRAALLTVLEVRDVMSACNIKELAPGYRLQVNDSVTIQK